VTTYNFIDGSITGQEAAEQKNYIPEDIVVYRNTVDFSMQSLDVSVPDVAQALQIPARTTVIKAFIRVITAETADGLVNLGYGTDADYWGKSLNIDVTGVASTVLTGSETWDAASIADGAEEMEEVSVVGAAMGDYAIATINSDTLDGILSAHVTAEDTVTIVVANNTGGAIDLASGTLEVMVFKAPRAVAPVYFSSADTIDITGSAVNGDVDIDGAKVEVVALCIKH
jgi:hypothetical protein